MTMTVEVIRAKNGCVGRSRLWASRPNRSNGEQPENPSAGYLLEVSKLAVFISDDNRPAFDDCLQERDFDDGPFDAGRGHSYRCGLSTQVFVLGATEREMWAWREYMFLTPSSRRMICTQRQRSRT